jgi:hypothetical protein
MDQENVVSVHNGILCSHEEERNVINSIFNEVFGTIQAHKYLKGKKI